MLSITENKALMAEARESLRGKWGLAVGTILLYFVIVAVAQAIPKIGGLIGFIWLFPYMMISTAKFYDDLLQDGSAVPSCAAEGNVA